MLPQVIALAVGHHFERQLVMVAQKDRPLAALRNFRRLPHDIGDRMAVLGRQRHVDARHQREMECHMAFVARTKVIQHIFRPLIGLREQHAIAVATVHFAP